MTRLGRSLAFGLVGLTAAAAILLGGAGASRAQGPLQGDASPAAKTASGRDGGAGVGESTYGCVESVPKGAQRPIVVDTFPQRGTSGWAATLSITVRHGKGERVLPSGLDLSSAVEAKKVLKQAGFAVPDQEGGAGAQIWTEPDDEKKPGATTHLELPLVLLPPEPGRNVMMLPPLPVAVARANGEIATVCTHDHPILVEDPIANTPDAMPRDNPDAIPQREEWTALKKALGWAALGLVVGAILALLVWRRLNQPKPTPPPPPPRPPWEVALEELDEVRHAGLLEVERYGEYFDRTSDALRRYLGARFGFDGLESTTDEILAALKKQAGGFIRFDAPPALGADGLPRPSFGPQPGIAIERVASFLRECDLVKFANLTPTPEQCAKSIATGESIVRGTMPATLAGDAIVDEAPPEIDPVAAAQLRAPFVTPPPTPKRVRSPYEPPDPEEEAAAGDAAGMAGDAAGMAGDAAGEAARGDSDATGDAAGAAGDAPPREPPSGGST
ncbi:MAG: hypothetical protein KF850_29270 [Labilithrix sp.]|nr:hypothetical protein [Labilithrix sp.]